MTCDNCNNKITGSSSCLYCGIAVKCPQCHLSYDPGDKSCKKCGAKREGPAIPAEHFKKVKDTNGQHDEREISGQPVTSDPLPPPEAYRRKIPPAIIGVLIAILVFIIIIVVNTFKNPEIEIEKTVTRYIQAVENHDYQTVLNLYHPDSPHIQDIQDFLDTPKDLNIEIERFFDLEIMNGSAEITVLVSLDSDQLSETSTDEIHFKLINLNKKWYIYQVD